LQIKMPVAVSVVIPAYNAARTLGEAIESALAQDFPGKEIIVVNDGSTDSTAAVLRTYGDRIRVIEQKNRGQSAARNAAIAAAGGEYLAFLDSDDYWLPGRISATVDALQADRAAGLALCDFRIIDRNTGKALGEMRAGCTPHKHDIFESWPPMTNTAVTMRTDLARECDGFPEGIGWGEDVLLWLAAIQRRPFVYVERVLAVYRGSASVTERRYTPRRRKPFEREVTARYGREGRKLVKIGRDQYASLLLASALTDLKNGHRLRGLGAMAALLKGRPSYMGKALIKKSGMRGTR
jgi:glycosyltransferase involved in cell wall biosynthesis